jgi:hypothetical protein
MEAGMDANRSLLDGGALRGTLLEDAIIAMEHLKDKMGMSGMPAEQVQLSYQTLAYGLSSYNGWGNANCTSNYLNELRPTRWRLAGYCPAQFEGEDHIYPVNWIDGGRHIEMDLIYCMDTVEFTCNREATGADRDVIREHYNDVMGSYPDDAFIEKAINSCFKGSSICNPADTNNNANKYPVFQRPGVLTTAIIFNNEESAPLTNN